MKCLGIDYGEKRIGLAYGDEVGVAVPLPAAVENDMESRFKSIAQVIQTRGIDRLVVGYPYNMDGSIGFKAREVDDFITELEQRFQLPVERVDESLTTHTVQEGLKATGRASKHTRKDRSSGHVDSRAAALILQDFLDMNPSSLA